MNITGAPRAARRRVIASSASGVAVMRWTASGSSIRRSEQTERLGAVANEQILSLAVVIKHHRVVLPTDARDLVAAERRAGWVLVVAVRPDPPGLDGPAHPIGAVAVARPDAGAETVERVIGDCERVGVIGERGDRQH